MANELSKIKIGEVTYDIKDNAARITIASVRTALNDEVSRATAEETSISTNLQAEVDRATSEEATITASVADEKSRAEGVESGLETRIQNLEARGRFLSGYAVATGLPTTYPTITSYPYTYAFKSGDYYIVASVPESGTKYMPDSASISKASEAAEWVIGKKETTDEIGVGDYFLYDGSKWVWVQNSQKTVNFSEIAGSPWDNIALATTLSAITVDVAANTSSISALDTAKVNKTQTIAGVDLQDNITKEEMQTALGLENLAYADTASGEYTPAGSISSQVIVTGGTITLNDFDTTTAQVSFTREDYQPEGTITDGYTTAVGTIGVTLGFDATSMSSTGKFTPAGTVKAGTSTSVLTNGSITVTIKDAETATAVTDITYDSYTPAGTIAAAEEAGNFSALTKATIMKVASGTGGAIQVEGTVDAPEVYVNDSSKDAFVKTLTAGTVDAASWTGATFTAAKLDSGFYTAGTSASWTGATYTAPSLGSHSSSAFNTDAVKTTVSGETLEFISAATANAITVVGTFSAGNVDFGTFNGGTVTKIDVSKFSGGSWDQGTFTAQKLPVVGSTANAVTAVSATASAPGFTGAYYKNDTATDTALKNVVFTGTAADVKFKGAKYLKQEIEAATFNGTSASLGFTGTEGDLSVSGSYDKAKVTAQTFTGSSVAVHATFVGTTAENLKITKGEYQKTTTGSATFNPTTINWTPTFTGTLATITVSPTVTVE